jgi:WS/DGAT/MGAT family acyltransferase
MAYAYSERLTALDNVFLALEDANVHMHVAAVAIFDAGPRRRSDGGIDIGPIARHLEAALPQCPRFRQRLAWMPGFDLPLWVDDPRFNLHYHLRHTALPFPGDERQLKRLVGRIVSQQLDRGKPLWEMWIIEGLEGDRFAMLLKVHHCLSDGVAGLDLLAALMSPDPNAQDPEPPHWIPRPAPGPLSLVAGEVWRRVSLPLDALRAAQAALSSPVRAIGVVRDAVESVGAAVMGGIAVGSPTPLNVEIGPHRRFDWTRFELAAAKEVKRVLGGTVNDVVLCVVAGAVGRFLEGRGERPGELVFRAFVPVSVRSGVQQGTLGNRVSFLSVQLPIGERDPLRRMEAVKATTRKLKQSRQAHGTELLEELGDRTFTGLFTQLARLGARQHSFNLVVTNVPGPSFPTYLAGARMRVMYPLAPLLPHQGVSLAIFSYDGGLHWGLNADWDAVPDLHDLVRDLDLEFEELCRAASKGPAETSGDGQDGGRSAAG